jgi:hypothetical protein
MAKSFPSSTFVGFDYHAPSIEYAGKAASDAGVSDRVKFEVAKAKEYPGKDYDFVTFFDCLHARQAGRQSQSGGTRVLRRIDPALYAGVVVARGWTWSRRPGREARLREVVTSGGFTRFRRASETPFNIVFEARP